MRNISLVGAMLLLMVNPIFAQDISETDILDRFNAQRDAFNEVRNTGAVKTRNLVLVTVEDVPISAQDESPELSAAPDEETLQPLVSSTDENTKIGTGNQPLVAPTTDQAADVMVASAEPRVFGQLSPELQVNLFINFAFDSAAIGADQRTNLDKMCIVMRDSDINVFQIVGHTDTAGTEDYNQQLSTLRAEEVARYLVSSCGIEVARLKTLGLGEQFPINASDTSADENRRVEFQALS